MQAAHEVSGPKASCLLHKPFESSMQNLLIRFIIEPKIVIDFCRMICRFKSMKYYYSEKKLRFASKNMVILQMI